MQIRSITTFIVCVMSGTTLAHAAQTPVTTTEDTKLARFALAAEAGFPTGVGASGLFTLSRHFTISAGYGALDYDQDFNTDDGDFTGALSFSNIQASLSYHPFAGSFHLAAGYFLTENEASVTGVAKGNGTFEIGDNVYRAEDIGRFTGKVKFGGSGAPFVGLGWAKSPGRAGLGFLFQIGVLLIDDSEVDLQVSGPLRDNAALQRDLAKAEQDVNDALASAGVFPVIKFGLMYRF
jgi:hypothetical protein